MTEISLRDYFAAQAVAGFLWNGQTAPQRVAAHCYALADALIAARTMPTVTPAAEAIPDDVRTSKGGLALT
jgi:hypothetical protein